MNDPERAWAAIVPYLPLVLGTVALYCLGLLIIVLAFRSRRLAWTRYGRVKRSLIAVGSVGFFGLLSYYWIVDWHITVVNHPSGYIAGLDQVLFYLIDDFYGVWAGWTLPLRAPVLLVGGFLISTTIFAPFAALARRSRQAAEQF